MVASACALSTWIPRTMFELIFLFIWGERKRDRPQDTGTCWRWEAQGQTQLSTPPNASLGHHIVGTEPTGQLFSHTICGYTDDQKFFFFRIWEDLFVSMFPFFIIKRRQIPPFGKQVVHFIMKNLGIGFPLGHTCSWACSQKRNLCEQGGCVVVKPLERSVPAMDGKSVQTPTFSGKRESAAATLPGFSLSQVLTLKQEGSEITFFHLFQGCVLGRCQER